jgi:UDP-glucose 4-epimerase
VADTAYWLCRVAECDALIGQTVNLGSGMETSVRELAKLVCAEAGRPDLLPIFEAARPGDVRRHLADNSRACELLGFRSRTDLRQGIRLLLDDLRARPEGVRALTERIERVNWVRAA